MLNKEYNSRILAPLAHFSYFFYGEQFKIRLRVVALVPRMGYDVSINGRLEKAMFMRLCCDMAAYICVSSAVCIQRINSHI